ncbi:hypothetical protein I8751_19315 [Nostocaceae cyanobacterium CENA357]|uniref:Uncharacterized protein n=1 Tax=Atlanticothrix silvestris CENA357 TaxID=1725252 RepID=A0A8J7HFT1_9CYAN|nr:hypothetical protein [Atlanticothrix silvestris]MBH8554472.1 hypothetical protein [Atlanticothrix silvestris CENA357]
MLNRYHHNPFSGLKNIRTSAVSLAIMALLLPACTNNLETRNPEEPQGNVTTEEVADNTNELLGQTVTIRSEPVRKISPTTFTVSDNQFFGGETILVVNASGQPATLPENAELQVTGKVAKFVATDIEKEYSLDLDPNLYREYESKPAIIAQSIAPAVKPGELSTNPSAYYNKVIAVPAEVEDIVGNNAFTLDEDQLIGGQDLLVLFPKGQTPVKEGEKIVVAGTLRPFVVADIERDYDLTWDAGLQKQLEVEYKNRPVLVAESVYPSAIPDIAK